ncbi:MAG: DUF2278 family protein [Asticcacaulis sp.]
MPLKNYSLLKGHVVDMRRGTGASPHLQVKVVDNDHEYRIAVNIQSKDKSLVQYLVRMPFLHPITDLLKAAPVGVQTLERKPGGMALDYIRGNLLQPQEMIPLPPDVPGPDNDLNEKIGQLVQRALADEDAVIYAFGETWGPETNKRDKYFGFLPGRGIHDIHMNQGNPNGPFEAHNGPWQDGGLVFEFPHQNQWGAVFLKFQSQAWHTDDQTGHTLPGPGGGIPSDGDDSGRGDIPVDHIPTEDLPDGMVKIVAALVNALQSPETETVTLLNTGSAPISLDGWKLGDKQKHWMPLSGTLGGGEALRITLKKPVELSNKGGIITLVNDRGVKVHGVSYTREAASRPGLSLTFS